MKRIFLVALLAGIVGCSGGPAAPAPTTAIVTGTTRSGSNIIGGASIDILVAGAVTQHLTTSASGTYALLAVPLGPLTIRASAAGYQAVTRQELLTSAMTVDFDLPAVAQAVLEYFGELTLAREPDGTYRLSGRVRNTGTGCAGGISGTTEIRTTASVVVFTAPWTRPGAILRPAEATTYDVCCAPADLPEGTYRTTFTFSTVPCP